MDQPRLQRPLLPRAPYSDDVVPAAPKQTLRTARMLAAVLISITLVSARFAAVRFPLSPSFMAAFVGASALLDLLTAMMLFDLYCIEGSMLFLGAACGYFTDAILIIPYGLMFPGVYPMSSAFSNEQTSAWLWLSWHTLFPAAVVVSARVPRSRLSRAERRVHAGWLMVGSLLLALGLTTVDILGRDFLPIVVQHARFAPPYRIITIVIGTLNLLASGWLLRTKSELSEMRVWLAVAVLANGLDVLLNAFSLGRYTLPWYLGKIEMLMSASIVLVALMRAWSSLYLAAVQLSESLRLTLNDRVRLQERFDREHMIAAELQQASLPRSLPHFESTNLCAVYRPAVLDLEIGGDWYDAFVLSDHRLVLTVGDVAGKGLAASLVMGKVRQMLRIAALVDPDPARMLNIADRALLAEHPDTLVTAFAAVLERETGRLLWASAGHPPSFIRFENGKIVQLESVALPLGLRDHDPVSNETMMEQGAMLVAYTDGLVEAERNIIDGIERVALALSDEIIFTADNPASALYDRVITGDARDDVAVVTLSYCGKPIAIRPRETESITWHCNSYDAVSVTSAREALRERLLARQIPEEEIFAIELAYGELIGNVVRYAPGPYESVLEVAALHIALTVIDQGSGFEFTAPTLADPMAENGRGLFLVASLSSAFHIERGARSGSLAHAIFPRGSTALIADDTQVARS